MCTDITKQGVNDMSIEKIHAKLERELGANWWDSTDQYERA